MFKLALFSLMRKKLTLHSIIPSSFLFYFTVVLLPLSQSPPPLLFNTEARYGKEEILEVPQD